MRTRNPRAVGYKVLLKLKKLELEAEVKTDWGFQLEVKNKDRLENEKRGSQEAYVVQIAPNAFKAYDDGTPWCKVGDLVLTPKYSGHDMHDIEEGEIYRLVNDDDILLVFDGEECKQ
jgi:co-chaperonin GroES (HSP10)